MTVSQRPRGLAPILTNGRRKIPATSPLISWNGSGTANWVWMH
jgi:hypothetical protein